MHTGAILAGILGQRQWQYDVYSKDVELANKMESSGKAGYVCDGSISFLFIIRQPDPSTKSCFDVCLNVY